MENETLIIFDCDGVLVDSEGIASEVFSRAVTELGLSMSPQETDRLFRGRSLPDCLRYLENDLALDVPADFLARLGDATEQAFEQHLHPVTGVRDVLEMLSIQGVARCVASSGSLHKIRHSLTMTQLIDFFTDAAGNTPLFSAEQVERGKPSPDLFLFAAKTMGFAPERCCVVEDSEAGVRAGLAAHMRVIAFVSEPGTSRSPELFAALGATVASSMLEVRKLLRVSGG